MVIRRHVRVSDVQIFGKDEDGWAVVQEVEGRLHVYVATAAIIEGAMPYGPLCDRLMGECGISPNKHVLLLLILTAPNAAMIRYLLERENLLPGSVTLSPSDLTALNIAGAALKGSDDPAAEEEQYDVHLPTDSQQSVSVPGAPSGSRRTRDSKVSRTATESLRGSTKIVGASRIIKAGGSLSSNGVVFFEHAAASSGTGMLVSLDTSRSTPSTTSKQHAVVGRSARFSAGGSFDMETMREALSTTGSVEVANDEVSEWQQQVGDGGELFVGSSLKIVWVQLLTPSDYRSSTG